MSSKNTIKEKHNFLSRVIISHTRYNVIFEKVYKLTELFSNMLKGFYLFKECHFIFSVLILYIKGIGYILNKKIDIILSRKVFLEKHANVKKFYIQTSYIFYI